VGSIAGCFVGALLYDLRGYPWTFIVFGIATLAGAPLGFASQKGIQPPKSVTKPLWESTGGRGKGGILVFFGFVVGCVGPGLVMSTLGFILKNQFGGSISTGAILFGVATINGFLLASRHIIGALGAPFFGVFVDRIGHRNAARLCFTAAAFALGAAIAAHGVMVLTSMILLFFIAAAIAMVSLSAKAATSGSRTYASFATALDLGAAVGPLVGWTILDFFSIPTLSFAVGGGLYAAAALIAFRYLKF
jgi:hypothetical protein